MSLNSQRLRKRSVVIQGHRTSLSLEQPFWDALKEIATSRRLSLARLIAEIDASRSGNLSSAARVYVLDALRSRP
jgi:predicted DNA-binding ribbon-helix-helix protein